MAKKSKCTLKIKGHHELIQQIEKQGQDTSKILAEAIELSGKHATTRFKKVIEDHRFSGITEDALIQNPKAVNDGMKITMNTGFDVEKGGAPAIWLDKGTPKQKPINFVKKIKKDKVVTGSIGYVLGQAWRNGMK